MKICTLCLEEKPLTEFHFRKDRNKHVARCKKCSYDKEYQKKYRQTYKDKIRKASKEHYHKNQEKISRYFKRRYQENKEFYNEYSKKWYKENKKHHNDLTRDYYIKNKEKIYEKVKERLLTDVGFKIKKNLSRRLNAALKGQDKSNKTTELLGCSVDFFLKHIESQFEEGMSWDNYGNTKDSWSLDHIKPCTAFDLQNESEQRECCHYTNLRPMWHIENIKKSNKF